ncbi:MAG: hypothetical protein RLZZ624_997 [Cyanobacteriota bacterium]|jgi:hypothetical protein
MATTRLTDPQKEELVARFSQGEASLALAEAYGVSANTISRVVRAALPAEVYESLKQQRARGTAAVAAASPPSPAEADGASRSRRRRSTAAETAEQPELPADSAVRVEAISEALPAIAAAAATATFAAAGSRRRRSSASSPAADQAGAQAAAAEIAPAADAEPKPLAIDDADDFGADSLDVEFSGDDTDADDDDTDFRDADQPFVPVAVSLTPVERREAVICQPLASAGFHGGAYMLVDKTVELQPKPLRDFSELGALPDDEAERQAISVFINPREAKRQCGRSQRVIKMPDASLLERTAPYLLAQGISRVVVEGALYALPGS